MAKCHQILKDKCSEGTGDDTDVFDHWCRKSKADDKQSCCSSCRSKKLREQFEKLEEEYENKLKGITLSEEEYLIYRHHKDAIQKGHFTYDDPETGYKVMTRLRHFLRGSCCGNACRHCVYNLENVAADAKEQRMFNGAFWIGKPLIDDKHLEHIQSPTLEKTKEDIAIEEMDPLLFKH